MVVFLLIVGWFCLVILFITIMIVIGRAMPVSDVIASIDIVQSRREVIVFVMTIHHRNDHKDAISIGISRGIETV